MMQRFGKHVVQVVKVRSFSYRDVEYDEDGWVDATKYIPEECDLVILRMDDDRSLPGWWTGNGWDGLRIKRKDKVLYWKRKLDWM